MFIPYAGLVFDLTSQLSAFASYTEIFQPQTQLDASNQPLDPRTGRQYEIGLKGEFLDGRLTASAAYFNILDENRALATAVAGTFVAAEEVESRGFEVEVTGSPLANVELIAGYTYTETEFVNGAAATVGQAFNSYTPEHMFQFWSKYTFDQGPAEGLSLAAGLRAFSSFYNEAMGARLEENGYTVVDAQIGYQFTKNLKATLTVTNLLDEDYYVRVGSPVTFNFQGEPRAVYGKLTASF